MGRPKGSLNRNGKELLRERLEARFNHSGKGGWSPVIEMADLAVELRDQAKLSGSSTDIVKAIDGMDKVARYLVPQMRSVELNTTNELTVSVQRKKYGETKPS